MKRCSINKSQGPSKQSKLTARIRQVGRIKKERSAMEWIIKLGLIVGWISGIVIAKGFWSTLFSVLVVPYAWYLVIEKIMIISGWL